MRRFTIACVMAATMVAILRAPHVAWAEPVGPKVAEHLEQLRASAAALEAGSFRSQARKLTKAVDEIAQWAAGHDSLTTGQMDQLRKVHKRLTSDAKMWAGANRQDKVDVLRQHAATVQTALTAMEPLAKAAPAAAGGGGTLTVLIRPGSGAASPSQTRTPQRRPTPGAGMGGPGAGMGGPAAGMGFRGDTSNAAYGDAAVARARRATRATRTTRGAGPAAGAGGLTIILREPNRTFTNVGQLRSYLNAQKAELATATVVFRIDGGVRWSDVQMVVNTFAAAPLTGPMRIADLKLRQAPASAIGATPPGPLPAGLTAAPAPSAAPVAQPTPAATPNVTMREAVDVLGAEVDPVLKDAKTVLFAVDVTATRFSDVLTSIMNRVMKMPTTMSVAVIAMNSKNQPVKIVDWTAAGRAAGAMVGSKIAAAGPAGDQANIAALTNATTAEFAKCEAIIYIIEGVHLPDEPAPLDAMYRLSKTPIPTGVVVVGQPGSEMKGVIQRVGNRPNNAAVFITP